MIANPAPFYDVEVTFYAVDGSVLTYDTTVDPLGPPPVPGYGLADPLKVGWQLPNGDQLYVQPEPFYGSVVLVVAQLSELAKLEEGVALWVRVQARDLYDPVTASTYTGDIVNVHGQITNIDAKPHPLGSIVTLSWLDHTAAENERDVGTYDYPAEVANVRASRVGDELGAALVTGTVPPVELAARPAGAVPARSYLVGLVDQCAEMASSSGPLVDYAFRPYLAADVDQNVGPLGPARIVFASRGSRNSDNARGELPGKLGNLGGGVWGVVIDSTPPPPGAQAALARIIDACHIELDVTYRLAKSERPDTYTIRGAFPGTPQVIVGEVGAKPIRGSIETELTDPADAVALAALNLNGRASDGWAADRFRWHADLAPTALVQPTRLFFDDVFSVAELQLRPVVIRGVDADQNPSGETWFAGQVTAAELVIAAGRFNVDLSTRRNLPIPAPAAVPNNGSYLCPAKMTGALAAVTPAQLDPRLTAFDARLLRSDY